MRRGLSPAFAGILIIIIVLIAAAGVYYVSIPPSGNTAPPPTTTTYTNPSDDVRNWSCDQLAASMNVDRRGADSNGASQYSNQAVMATFYENWYIYKHCPVAP